MVPINIEGSNYEVETDYLVLALGSHPDKYIEELGLKLNKWGSIEVDENSMTSDKKIFAGGDIAGAKATVAWAARSGRNAAENIMKQF